MHINCVPLFNLVMPSCVLVYTTQESIIKSLREEVEAKSREVKALSESLEVRC